MLLAPSESPYDLHFSVGRTPVRVHVGFWIFSAILGWNNIERGVAFVLIWVLCVFASILLHELGHVWAGKLFGSDGHIVLYSFGGLAIGSKALDRRWERVFVSLAGPGIQLLLFGILWLVMQLPAFAAWFVGANELVQQVWLNMVFINLLWPLFNLLPVWPLDGGMVCREVCEAANPRSGTRVSLGISIATAAFIAINTVAASNGRPIIPYLHGYGMYTVILFGLLAFESYQLLRQLGRPWDRGGYS
ncbi:MAG: site-2 protease family protein [Gemmataceae bacterium]|nr:site-2 protease family protein [Gemmataceae bacterium]